MITDPNSCHVYGHTNDYLGYDKLMLEQKLNKRCDELAKYAISLDVGLRMNGSERNHS